MKKVFLKFILIGVLSFPFTIYGNNVGETYKYDVKRLGNPLEQSFGYIRADLVRYACDVLNVNDTTLIKKIDHYALKDFKTAVHSNTNASYKQLDTLMLYVKGIKGKDLNTEYKTLTQSIDDVCDYLVKINTEQASDINITRTEFHQRLAKAAIEYNAYQFSLIDTIYVKEQFEELFAGGFFVERYIGSLSEEKRGEESEGATKDESVTTIKQDTLKGFISSSIVIIVVIVLLLGIGYVCYSYMIKKKKVKNNHQKNIMEVQQQTTDNTTGDTQVHIEQEVDKTPKPTPLAENKDRSCVYDDNKVSVLGASIKGNSHVEMKLPCQDCCGYENIGHGWGIAVTSDGAGSSEHSEIGSAIVVKRTIDHFKQLLTNKGWLQKDILPTDAEWTQSAYNVLKAVYDDLTSFAAKKGMELKSLSATVIVVIHTPYGILTCHVGDGRAGYMNVSGEWFSVITPHKGEEANQTIFITSEFWKASNFVMSGVMVPECRVVRDNVRAFTLMSDGCEATSWLCNQCDANGRYYDPNKPYKKFYEPLLDNIKNMHEANLPTDERLEKWREFLNSGGKFAIEPDDKTMILGLVVK